VRVLLLLVHHAVVIPDAGAGLLMAGNHMVGTGVAFAKGCSPGLPSSSPLTLR
jgi:hypothetical protein